MSLDESINREGGSRTSRYRIKNFSRTPFLRQSRNVFLVFLGSAYNLGKKNHREPGEGAHARRVVARWLKGLVGFWLAHFPEMRLHFVWPRALVILREGLSAPMKVASRFNIAPNVGRERAFDQGSPLCL